jgi:D-alanyl-D-alanine dipeptidase
MEAEGFRYFSREWWHFTHPEYPSQAMNFVIR